MDWIQIVSAFALIMFIVILFPAARDRMQNSPKGTSSDWMGFVVLMMIIALFILLLVQLL